MHLTLLTKADEANEEVEAEDLPSNSNKSAHHITARVMRFIKRRSESRSSAIAIVPFVGLYGKTRSGMFYLNFLDGCDFQMDNYQEVEFLLQ